MFSENFKGVIPFQMTAIMNTRMVKNTYYYLENHYEVQEEFRFDFSPIYSHSIHFFCIQNIIRSKVAYYVISYHPGEVLKDTFSQNQNSIFEFSMVDYPRRRWDLERVPPIVSKKNFDKIQWKKQCTEQKKKKPVRTGFEPASHHTCSLATQLYANYSHSVLSRTSLLFHYLIFMPLSQCSNPKSSSIIMGSDPLHDRYLFHLINCSNMLISIYFKKKFNRIITLHNYNFNHQCLFLLLVWENRK